MPSYRRSKLDRSTLSLIAHFLGRVLVQKTQNVVAPAPSSDAVLSQSLPQQADKLQATQFDAFDQVHDHPHIRQHRRHCQTRLVQNDAVQSQFDRYRQLVRWLWIGRGWRRTEFGSRFTHRGACAAPTIEQLLFLFPGCRLVMCGTPLPGTLSAMMLPTAERATQIPPTCVAGVSQKPNAAVPTVRHPAAQFGMGLHHRVQRGLILTNKRIRAIVLMPIRAKRE